MRSRNYKRVWRPLRSVISVAFEILGQRLRVYDSEAYQEMIRMNLETFYEILTAT